MLGNLALDTASIPFADGCSNCSQRSTCFLATRLPDEHGKCAGAVRRRVPLARDEHLFNRGSDFRFVYIVCAGSLKTQRETLDGDLVITGFHFPGDIVGIEAVADRTYPCDAIATTDVKICQLDFSHMLARCASDPNLHQWVISRISLYHRRRDGDLCWSTSMPAQQRVLRFFVTMYEQLRHACGYADASFALPMRKQDIARYLHITPETLSRNLRQLRRQGLLQIDRNRFSLPNTLRARQLTQY